MSAAVVAGLIALLAGPRESPEMRARRTLAEVERKRGPESTAAALRLNELAVVLQTAGQPREAATYARRAYEIFAREALETAAVAGVLYNMAAMERDCGRQERAHALARLAVRIRRAVVTDVGPDLSEYLVLAGELSWELKRHAEAAALLKEAVAARDGAGRPQALRTLSLLAATLAGGGHKPEAAEVLRRALGLAEASPETPPAALADLLERLGDAEEAEDAAQALQRYRRALAIRDASPPQDPWALSVDLGHVAMDAQNRGAVDESDALYARVAQVLEQYIGLDDPRVIDVYWELGGQSAFFREGQKDKAAVFWRKAFEGIEKYVARTDAAEGRRGLAHASLLAEHLASARARAGDLAGGEAYLRRLVAINEKVYGADRESVAEALVTLAEFHREHGQREKAEAVYGEALAAYESVDKSDYEGDVRPILMALVKLSEEAGDVDATVALYERIVSAEMEHRVYGTGVLIGALQKLADLEARRGRFERAEEQHRKALDVVQRGDATNTAAAISVLEAYASFLAGRHRLPEAQHLRATAASLK
jgi:tetratricopeptide (TPR) repeat protein